MAVELDTLLEQALALSPEQRALLAEKTLSRLQPPDPEVERLWLEKARRRIAAYEAGKGVTFSAEESFVDIERELGLR